jgi:flagellar biogenesis protein FliO
VKIERPLACHMPYSIVPQTKGLKNEGRKRKVVNDMFYGTIILVGFIVLVVYFLSRFRKKGRSRN